VATRVACSISLGLAKLCPGRRITTEETPPPLLQIEPARSFGNEEVLNAWMLCEPGTGFSTAVTAEIISDDENVTGGIISFDVSKQSNVAFGVA
jgi:hypothetical protein